MSMAEVASLRGTCRVKVGAVAARNNRVLLTGYAGSLPGQPHCVDIQQTTKTIQIQEDGVGPNIAVVGTEDKDVGVGCDFYWRGEGTVTRTETQWNSNGTSGWKVPYEMPVTWRKHCQRTIHAERNVLSIAAKEGISLDGATYYTFPFAPCDDCARMLVMAGAKRVVWTKPKPGFEHYADSPILREAGVETMVLDYTSVLA